MMDLRVFVTPTELLKVAIPSGASQEMMNFIDIKGCTS
jgi:hypothetical protein